ncbi:MAG TPA: HlyD family efflux transporter periplasmic adaptor subunit [Anaerolineales bacterium]|nr:HlyD family efflux transporter periplasmic adaptor subunit [Anaerolineales bacterium]
MKYRASIILLLVFIFLAGCSAGGKSTAIPTIVLDSGSVATPQVVSSQSGGVTASGQVVADQEAQLAFRVAGTVKSIPVAAGDQVKAGQVLIQLDDTVQQIQLDQATLNLNELTSPAAIAAAQKAVAQDQQDLTNAQVALNTLTAQYSNEGLIANAQAGLVLAQNALKDAQTAYDATSGDPHRDPAKALAYQRLYTAQQNYDHALYLFNVYTGKANQAQVSENEADVALAKARLADDQTLLTALTGGEVPADASGAGYAQLMQAKLAVQSAQASVDAAHLVAPFDGQIAFVQTAVGEFVSPGQVLVALSDVNHFHVETKDLSERDVPQVKVGQSVTVSIKALNENVTGKVTAISPLADSLGGDVVYTVTIELDTQPAGIRAGMSVDVQFDTSQ